MSWPVWPALHEKLEAFSKEYGKYYGEWFYNKLNTF